MPLQFLETRFPPEISFGAVGGPGWRTDLVTVDSGFEQANVAWAASRHAYDVAHGLKSQAQLDELIAFFRVVKGRAIAFRFKDWADFSATQTQGRLGLTGAGTGVPTYQMFKRYTVGTSIDDRKIAKPVSGTISAWRSGSPLSFGAGAGQIALDTTTGIVTFVADAQQNVTAVSAGATTNVTLAAALAPLAIGERLWLQDLTGTIAASLNNLAHPITNIVGAVYTISTVTTGLAWTSGGTGRAYPQAGETLQWAGELDVPCRFDTDQMQVAIAKFGAYTWAQIPIIEVRL